MRRFLARFTRRIGGGAGLVAVVCSLGAFGSLSTHAAQPEAAQPDPAAAQAKPMEPVLPGEYHEWFGYFLGEWDVHIRFVQNQQETSHAQGTARFYWQIPNRWLAQETQVEVQDGSSLQFFQLVEYDPHTDKFNLVAVEDTTHGMVIASGALDPSNEVLSLRGRISEPVEAAALGDVQMTTRIKGANHFETVSLSSPSRNQVLRVFTEYRRKDASGEAEIDEAAFLGRWELDQDAMREVLEQVRRDLLQDHVANERLTEEEAELAGSRLAPLFLRDLDGARFIADIRADRTVVLGGSLVASRIPEGRLRWLIEDGRFFIVAEDGSRTRVRVVDGTLRFRLPQVANVPASFETVLKRVGSASGIDAYLGSWTIDEPATRAALINAFDADRGEEGSFADEFGGTSEELADYFLASVRATLTFADDGTYRVVSSAPAWQRGDEVRPWEFRGDHAILDAGEPNPARLQVKGGKMHMTPLDEPGMPEGLVIILERARGR